MSDLVNLTAVEAANVNLGQGGQANYAGSTATITPPAGYTFFSAVLIIDGANIVGGTDISLTPNDDISNRVSLTPQEQQDIEGTFIPGKWTSVRMPGTGSQVMLVLGK